MSTLRQSVLRRAQAAEPVARIADRTVVGDPVEIAEFLVAARTSGRLLQASRPQAMPAGDRRVFVRVRVLDRPLRAAEPARAPAPRRPWRRRPAVIGTAVLAVLVVLAGVGYLLYLLVQALIAAIPMVLGGLFVLGVIWVLLGRAGVCCPGLHCPGCRH